MRIATIVYVLVNTHGRNQSLLTQLGVRGRLRFTSGYWSVPGNSLVETPLVFTRTIVGSPNSSDNNTEYLPHLGDSPSPSQTVQFSRWWKDETIYKTKSLSLSRMNLVFALRNKDGGSHLDPEIDDAAYLAMSRLEGGRVYHSNNGHETLVPNVHLATMRQIGWELEETMKTIDV